MSWYRTGTVSVTNGSKTVTGVGTLWTTAVNAGDAFALVDANLNPTGAWYEVESVTNNTTLVLKQSYAGSTGSNKQYCVFNLVGNMTTPSFAQRLATFFANFQTLLDKPTSTPTALGIPVADENGDIDSGWIKDASTTVKGVVELATPAEVLAGEDDERVVTPDTLTAKILGTVSQVGGVPTGAVIESGTNANGTYVKFADGTMICWWKPPFVNIGIPSLDASGPHAWNYPAEFIDSFNLVVSADYVGVHATSLRACISSVLPTALEIYVFNTDTTTTLITSNDDILMYSAIGRWF